MPTSNTAFAKEAIIFKVGDIVEWEHFTYRKGMSMPRLREGTIIGIHDGVALVKNEIWQRVDSVHLARLRIHSAKSEA